MTGRCGEACALRWPGGLEVRVLMETGSWEGIVVWGEKIGDRSDPCIWHGHGAHTSGSSHLGASLWEGRAQLESISDPRSIPQLFRKYLCAGDRFLQKRRPGRLRATPRCVGTLAFEHPCSGWCGACFRRPWPVLASGTCSSRAQPGSVPGSVVRRGFTN